MLKVKRALPVPAVADERHPRPVSVAVEVQAETVTMAELLVHSNEIGRPLRESALVCLTPHDNLRVQPDTRVVDEARAVDIADIHPAGPTSDGCCGSLEGFDADVASEMVPGP